MPGVVTKSRSRPSSLKNPLSRATRTGRSCTAFITATWGLFDLAWMFMAFPLDLQRFLGRDDPPRSPRLSTAWTSGALRHRRLGAHPLAQRADHHELARPHARDHPAARDLGRIGVERAFIIDGAVARAGAVVGLAERHRAAGPAAQQGREQGSGRAVAADA